MADGVPCPAYPSDLYDLSVSVLTIDTATSLITVGLVDGTSVTAATPVDESRHAAQQVLAAVDASLAAAAVSIGDLEQIVVGCGPGSFTGLRIGIATAIGLGAASEVPVVGVGTLSVLREAAGSVAVAVIDARRGEVFAEGPGVLAGTYTPATLIARLASGTLCVGDGAILYAAELRLQRCYVPAADDRRHRPQPAVMARLAAASDQAPEPIYLRPPDAVPMEQRA